MSRALTELTCITGPLLGGITDLWVVRSREVLTIPEPTALQGNIITQAITLRIGKSFTRILHNAERNSAQYSFKPRTSEQGTLYDAELSLFQRSLRWAQSLEISKLTPGEYIAAVKDADGNMFIVGTAENPLRFEADGNSQQRPGQTPGAEWKFSGSMIYQPLYWTGDAADFPNITNGAGGVGVELGEYEDDEFTPQLGAVYNVADPDVQHSVSGIFRDALGRPFTPEGNTLYLELTFTDFRDGTNIPGMVLFDFSADINLATAAAVGGAVGDWPDDMRQFITSGGTGAHSDTGQPGRFDLHIDRAAWSGTYDDDMPLHMQVRLLNAEYESAPAAALFVAE